MLTESMVIQGSVRAVSGWGTGRKLVYASLLPVLTVHSKTSPFFLLRWHRNHCVTSSPLGGAASRSRCIIHRRRPAGDQGRRFTTARSHAPFQLYASAASENEYLLWKLYNASRRTDNKKSKPFGPLFL